MKRLYKMVVVLLLTASLSGCLVMPPRGGGYGHNNYGGYGGGQIYTPSREEMCYRYHGSYCSW